MGMLRPAGSDKKFSTESSQDEMDDQPSSRQAPEGAAITSSTTTTTSSSRLSLKSFYLEEMTLDDFVCVPQALESTVERPMKPVQVQVAHQSSSSKGQASQPAGADQLAQVVPGGSFQLAALETVFRYLEPTLIRPPERRGSVNGTLAVQRPIVAQIATPTEHQQLQTGSASASAAAMPGPEHLTSTGDKHHAGPMMLHRKLVQAKEGKSDQWLPFDYT